MNAALRGLRTDVALGIWKRELPRVYPARIQHHRHGMLFHASRCYAGRGTEPSWAEIAQAGVSLVTDTASKVGNTLKKAASSLLPGSHDRSERQTPGRPDPSDMGRQLFGGSIMGRMLGGLVSSALSSVAEQMAQASEAAAATQERSARLVQSSAELRRLLGGPATLLGPISQASTSTSINGVRRQRIILTMPVADTGGRIVGEALAERELGEGPRDQAGPLELTVRLSSGKIVRLDDSSVPPATIDVEWKRVD
ncbi:hypothetical protein ACKKBG_A20485 [Auxenochlorella protothecoides x Auxenochlorella symbiontica]